MIRARHFQVLLRRSKEAKTEVRVGQVLGHSKCIRIPGSLLPLASDPSPPRYRVAPSASLVRVIRLSPWHHEGSRRRIHTGARPGFMSVSSGHQARRLLGLPASARLSQSHPGAERKALRLRGGRCPAQGCSGRCAGGALAQTLEPKLSQPRGSQT